MTPTEYNIDLVASLVGAILSLIIGISVAWTNPRKRQNRALLFFTTNTALWMLFRINTGLVTDWVTWLKLTMTMGAFIPFQLWNFLDSIQNPKDEFRQVIRRGITPFVVCVLLASLTTLNAFVSDESIPTQMVVGFAFWLHSGGLLLYYILLVVATVYAAKKLTGIARLELMLVLQGGAIAAFSVIVLMVVRQFSWFSIPGYWSIFIVVGVFIFWSIAITTHRIFEAKMLFRMMERRGLQLLLVCVIGWAVWSLVTLVFPLVLAYIVSVTIMLAFSGWSNQILDGAFSKKNRLRVARQAAFAVTTEKHTVVELEREFSSIICRWWNTEKAFIFTEKDGRIISESEDFALNCDRTAIEGVKRLGWASPERMGRERQSPESTSVSKLLQSNDIGLILYHKGYYMSVFVALGRKTTRFPYTYENVRELLEILAIIESAYSRCMLSEKVQRSERLATVGLIGAGIAHEIRNPLVSIKTFAHLLPLHYDAPTFRERFSRLIGEEVERIDQLTVKLLEMASPQVYNLEEVSISDIVGDAIDLVSTRSDVTEIEISTDFAENATLVQTDKNGAKQVMLNLLLNAIQAQERDVSERWVSVHTSRLASAEIEVRIADNGPGISDEDRSIAFEPFHSTKSTGFGLGMPICADILSGLGARISIDPIKINTGAVIRVVFPCPQPSSS